MAYLENTVTRPHKLANLVVGKLVKGEDLQPRGLEFDSLFGRCIIFHNYVLLKLNY